jgi:hypothetical protein
MYYFGDFFGNGFFDDSISGYYYGNLFYRSGRFLTIQMVDTDWDCQTETDPAGYFPNGLNICSINTVLSAGGRIILKEKGVDSNVQILNMIDLDGCGEVFNFGHGRCYPAIKISDIHNGDIINIVFKQDIVV